MFTEAPSVNAAPTSDATQSPVPTATAAVTLPPTATVAPTAAVEEVMKLGPLATLEPGTYFIDPDGDPATSLRVFYEIAAEGWQGWIGAAKFSDAGNVGISITTVSNLVSQGCTDHSWQEPPVGSTVADLTTALVALAPFEITSPPSDVTAFGYQGKHLSWKVPDLPVHPSLTEHAFTKCIDGDLKSWVAFIDTGEPGDAFYGYTGPAYSEDFWILDVDGTRLMIAAEASAGSPVADIAERDAILDSIRIEL
jgi:hypothetical protein